MCCSPYRKGLYVRWSAQVIQINANDGIVANVTKEYDIISGKSPREKVKK